MLSRTVLSSNGFNESVFEIFVFLSILGCEFFSDFTDEHVIKIIAPEQKCKYRNIFGALHCRAKKLTSTISIRYVSPTVNFYRFSLKFRAVMSKSG